MKKKVLVVASTSNHLLTFHMPYIAELKKTCDVYTMSRDTDVAFADFNVNFEKKILSFKHLSVIKQIRKILKENDFDVVFLNTTLAAIIVRCAIKKLKKKPKVVNIVHGYLFGEKDGFFKRKLYLSIEKMFRKQTNDIIVMNNEDYDIATKNKLCLEEVHMIRGMGINGDRFKNTAKPNNGLEEEFVFSFIGELSVRKNQMFLIDFVKKLNKLGIKSKLNLIGDGVLKNKIQKKIIKNKLQDQIKLVGYTANIEKYINGSNYYICASKIEGMPFNILEAMYAGSVVFSSDIKGTVDLIDDFENGVLFKLNDMDDLVNKFRLVKNNLTLQNKIRKNAVKTAKKYLFNEVFEENVKLFNELIK